MTSLVDQLTQSNIVQHGEFVLKSGQTSSIYVDLRQLIAYPKLLTQVAESLWNQVKDLSFDLVCGVPYTALPLATLLSVEHNIPMLIRRKEAKNYGTKKVIEGIFTQGQNCLIIEDVITTGGSVLETIELLEHEGLTVTDVIVCVDREQGGQVNIEEAGYRLHRLITLSDLHPHPNPPPQAGEGENT